MNEGRRLFYYFIFGALGGATGWLLGGLAAPAVGVMLAGGPGKGAGHVAQQIAFGVAVGTCIGLFIAAHDGFASRSFRRFLKRAAYGVGLGAIAGGVAHPLSQSVYAYLAGGRDAYTLGAFLIFTLCWVLFGGLIGCIEGVNKGTQNWKGSVGGAIGGLIGGAIYKTAVATPLVTDYPDAEQVILAASLAFLGGTIGAAVVFVTTKLREAFVEIVSGKRMGDKDDVTKYVASRGRGNPNKGIIGSDSWSADVYLPGDKGVRPQHASISLVDGEPTLTVLPNAVAGADTIVNGERVKSVTGWKLKDGDRLQIGSTALVYRQKKK